MKPLAGVVIGVDAGHQKTGDSRPEPVAPGSSEKKPRVAVGTRGAATGVPEYELTLAVALRLEALLLEAGAEVVMARRENDVNISNAERAVMMNEAGADLVVRIHADGSESESARGASMLVPAGGAVKQESRAASEVIYDAYIAATGANRRGIVERGDLTGFNWSQVPCALIEMGFMSNPDEDRLMNTDEYRDKMAKGLFDGIINWKSEFAGFSANSLM